MKNTIKLEARNVYGETKLYPTCERGKALAAIAGTKTITRDTIQRAAVLGFRFEAAAPALEL